MTPHRMRTCESVRDERERAQRLLPRASGARNTLLAEHSGVRGVSWRGVRHSPSAASARAERILAAWPGVGTNECVCPT